MKSRRAVAVLPIVAIVIAGLIPVVYAQGMGMGGGKGGGRMYNPATETTVSGTIEAVKTISGRQPGHQGIHLELKTTSGTCDVHVGPSHYVESKGFKFAKGDQVEVTGSKVTFEGHPAIIAREVKMDGKLLTLRNAQGIPEWSGGRWRRK